MLLRPTSTTLFPYTTLFRSSFHTRSGKNAEQGLVSPGGFFSLEPQDRAWLHARIAQRFDAMLDAGFIDEVLQLRARGDLQDRKSTRLNSSHQIISYAVFCLK